MVAPAEVARSWFGGGSVVCGGGGMVMRGDGDGVGIAVEENRQEMGQVTISAFALQRRFFCGMSLRKKKRGQ
jgi:hypothetical protein